MLLENLNKDCMSYDLPPDCFSLSPIKHICLIFWTSWTKIRKQLRDGVAESMRWRFQTSHSENKAEHSFCKRTPCKKACVNCNYSCIQRYTKKNSASEWVLQSAPLSGFVKSVPDTEFKLPWSEHASFHCILI